MNYNRLRTVFNIYSPFVHIAIILFLGIAAYANSLDVPLQLDDRTTIRVSIGLNSNLLSLHDFISKGRWFADLTFALNRRLHGEQVMGFHLVNLAIHLLSAGALYLMAQRVIAAMKQTFQISDGDLCSAFVQRFIPFASAVLFVSHPVQTQAVTYISQRYTALATLLYLSALLSYLCARISLETDAKKLRTWLWGAACLLCLLLAMKSKEISFTLPVMFALFEFALFRGRLLKSPLFIIIAVVALLIIPLQLIYGQGSYSAGSVFNQVQLAAAETQTISRTDYLLTQSRVVSTYLRLLILPINQNWDYDYPLYHTFFTPAVYISMLLHISLLGLAVVVFIRSKRQLVSTAPATGIVTRLASLGIVWFYLALSVESSLIPIRDVIFEHRIYLPSVGFFMAVSAGIALYGGRCRKASWIAVVILALVLVTATAARNRIWSDEMVLWQDVLKKAPNKARANLAIGTLYIRKYMPEKAVAYFVRAVELDPGRDYNWISLSSAIFLTDRFGDRCSDGTEYHIDAETVDPVHRKEWLAISSNNLGLAYEYLGNRNLARESYRKAVSYNRGLGLAWYNLALVAEKLGDAETVAVSLNTLRAINPLLGQQAQKNIMELRR